VGLALRPTEAADPPLIRFGHGFAAEEQVWLMAARRISRRVRHEIPAQARLVPGNPERFQAYLASELDGGNRAPRLAVTSRERQGLDIR